MDYTRTQISDILSEMEDTIFVKGKELAPFDMNLLRDIETQTSDSNIVNRIKETRTNHENVIVDLPDNWESDPHG